ncbi:MAG: hypothetical protein KC684_04130 [Candidatus Omnitrophica bacterium]|nr:hypothetical protein [Candidatus Omnitrophota bacterium]
MADEKEDISKKCAETGTTLKRARRYYRNGKYYINKAAFKAKLKKDIEATQGQESAA